ncbi:MAG TPA: nicotinate-nucleotide adenylyltransferase [Dehalococcoidia bacterium]|nr:nicotinate-nucleotide adenylyltransferase [Dehalococcoidia bacterium]
MKLGVLGGTFDPPHVGHVSLAEVAIQHLGLDKLLFVPAGDPWRKADQEITAGEHRLEMTRLAVDSLPRMDVSTLELDRPGPSYTVDTLGELLARYGPDTELYFVMGQDALLDMPNWKEPHRIVALAWLAVALRSPGRDFDFTDLEAAIPGISRRLVILPMSFVDVSGTAIREWARQGGSLDGLVPPGVESYIKNHALYTQ